MGSPATGTRVRASLVWRRGRDLNPRQSFWPCDGLANRCLRPLGHLSPELVGPALRSSVLDIQYLSSGTDLSIKQVGYTIPFPYLYLWVILNTTRRFFSR